MSVQIWEKCLKNLQEEFPAQQFNTWIRPLRVDDGAENGVRLLAPNRFVRDWVADKFLSRIRQVVADVTGDISARVELEIAGRAGSSASAANLVNSMRPRGPAHQANKHVVRANPSQVSTNSYGDSYDFNSSKAAVSTDFGNAAEFAPGNTTESSLVVPEPQLEFDMLPASGEPEPMRGERRVEVEGGVRHQSNLNPSFTFESFVQGKSNQLAMAAAQQVADNPGSAYNPLFIYGGVGLGKTHLMHAVGSEMLKRNPNAHVVYLHSERFVADMVKALQLNAINDFKRYYRSVDALLIDDIQFFAGKERSQEEFFYTFNALLENGQQMILTSDRYPKEIKGMEERLKSRFGWGLTVAIEPPELETRVAILMKKAQEAKIVLPDDSAFFLAQKIRSNVRELEGALKRVIANAHFTGSAITTPFIKESLKDLLALQDKQVSIDNIQRVVADYYKIKVADLLSKRRSRSVARPRQMAMSLSKELTNHSLPEIGNAFGGRDHTTVLHACRKIKELRETDTDIAEDYKNLLRHLTA